MGGHRGYGPTHSQSLEKFLIGLDEFHVIALNKLVSPVEIYRIIASTNSPTIVIENKIDYGRNMQSNPVSFYRYAKNNFKFPTAKISPINQNSKVTLVTYGGCVDYCEEVLIRLFEEDEIFIDVIILSSLRPFDFDAIIESLDETRHLLTVEESSGYSGIGSEVVASLKEKMVHDFKSLRVASDDVPIPSCRNLEDKVLVNADKIYRGIKILL